MLTFGHAVKEVERSSQHVVVRETATTSVAILFAAGAFLAFIGYRSVLGSIIAAFFASLAAYAAVTSSFLADQNLRALVIKRKLGPWTIARTYQAATIHTVFVRHTIKGDGLAIRFNSGRSKGLTMSLSFDSTRNLAASAAALNHFLSTSR